MCKGLILSKYASSLFFTKVSRSGYDGILAKMIDTATMEMMAMAMISTTTEIIRNHDFYSIAAK